MKPVVTVVLVACFALADVSVGVAWSQSAAPQPGLQPVSVGANHLPPPPLGKATVLGGEILSVDPVRDEIRIRSFAQRSVTTIRFDERTRVYRDGKLLSLRQIAAGDHASVETVLDGTRVFALSIHMLSHSPEGELKGRIVEYNPVSRELTVNSNLFRDPIKLVLAADATVVRTGKAGLSSAQSESTDLARGTLVSVRFASAKDGRGVASHVGILASAGSVFVIAGNISALDMHSRSLILVDPQDQANYPVLFDSDRILTSHTLHLGDHLRVTASYDGDRYLASAIAFD
jgi:hypothetical protein